MEKAYNNIFLFLSFILFSASNGFGQCATDVPTAERDALIALYNATDGANWTNNTNWNTSACVSDWYGVTVVNETVWILDLKNNSLSGTIPTEIGDLSSLVTLDLGTNALIGTIPSQIGNLSNLSSLRLNNNQLTNSIPSEIGNLSNLSSLYLPFNNLSGSLPSTIGNLTNLTSLSLMQNDLTGSIPSSIGNLTSLSSIALYSNQLTGSIPQELGNLSNLSSLLIGGNQLSGSIPSQLGGLSSLITLNFHDNQLTGTIPSELGNLSLLSSLSLSYNQLTGMIPSELGNLSSLVTLNLSSNQLTGNIPSSINLISTLNYFYFDINSFVFINFENEHVSYTNNLTTYRYTPQAKVDQVETPTILEGNSYTFTTSLSSPNNSYQWYKDDVAITGATSKDYTINSVTLTDAGVYHVIATNSIVTGLTLERNTITLAVTSGTCGVPTTERDALMALYNATDGANWTNTLANNQPWDINIPVCDWYGVTVENANVTELNLSSNNLIGVIPSEIENLSLLKICELYTNQLTSIPSSIGNLLNLEKLTLSENQLTSIPSSIGNLNKLEVLYISHNQLSGAIPSELGGLTNLVELSLHFNQFTGTIPSSFSGLSGLYFMHLNDNQLSGVFPSGLSTLNNFAGFRFQNNKFVFKDFENQHVALTNTLSSFYSYSPQAKVDQVETPAVTEGSSYTFTTSLSNPNNSYQWYKDGVAITGATSKDYTINPVALTDAGVYHVVATNSIVTGLALERNTITLAVTADTCGVSTAERDALMDLYNATGGANWTNTLANNQPWNINVPVCDWYGVTVANGTVTRLDLSNNQLTGLISPELNNLVNLQNLKLSQNQITGSIPSELGGLANLLNLTLNNNQLTGSIPSELGSLSNLQGLALNSNLLTGNIPSELGNLTNLIRLVLKQNQLSGNIPNTMGNLLNLVYLEGSYNQLTGAIPATFGNLIKLQIVLLDHNQLTGVIPIGLGNLVELRDLWLDGNQLTGTIPTELGNLTNLETLWLHNNQLTGNIPITLTNLVKLRHLYVENNLLSGPIPSFLNIIPPLKDIRFGTNAFIFSDFEDEHVSYTGITNYIYTPQAKVDQVETPTVTEGSSYTFTTSLSSPNNSYQWYKDGVAITGATSKDYTINPVALTDAGVYHVMATNSIVTGLTLERNTVTLSVTPCGVSTTERDALLAFYNAAGGPNWTNTLANNKPWDINIPVCGWYGVTVTSGHVTWLDLNGNNLIGTLSSQLKDLPSLEGLFLYDNQIAGTIPSQLGDLSNLKYLNFNTNQLTGSIPPELGNLSLLRHLYLANNKLSGNIPESLGGLTSLWILGLSGNQLEGAIPSQLGNLSSLQTLNLPVNQLSGAIPTSLGNLSALKNLHLHFNQLSGPIPSSLGNLSNLRNMTLNNNQLTGEIPSSLGNLSLLQYLQLQSNQLEGPLPMTLGNLSSLIYLYLESNQLSGTIPPSISLIASLNRFRFQENAFIFNDFETEHTTYVGNLSGYQYSPQAKVDQVETPTVTEGSSYTFTTSLSSPNNSYQWYKDGVAITGATSKDYTINPVTLTDAGVYHVMATNSIVTGLTLERHTITMNVNPGLPTNPTYCSEKILAEQALTNLLNHLIDEVKAGTTIPAIYNPVEMQAFAPYINCANPAIYNFQYLSGEGSARLVFSYGTDCCQQNIDLYWNVCVDTIGVDGQDIIDGLVTIPSVSVDESGTFNLKYDFTNNCTTTYIQNNQNQFPREEAISCLNINCDGNYNPNAFCYSQQEDYPTVASLTPWGNDIIWYSAETGGQQYSNTDDLIDEAIESGGVTYWWDDTTDNIVTRTAATVEVFIDIEGDHVQIFSKYAPAPTLTDIDLVNDGNTIYWYENDSSTTVLDINTLLVDGQTYYASSCNSGDDSCFCRFPVTVIIGVIPPKGDPVQYVCEQSTLDDIVPEIENVSGMSVLWYDEAGNPLAANTPVVDGTTYYAAQIDGNNVESSNRLAILVYIKSTDDPVVTEINQTFYATDPPPKVKDLKATGIGILWYSQPEDGTPYDPEFDLVDGTTYYAEQVFGQCASANRIAVTVNIKPEQPQPLLGCELFRPEFLKHYAIDAWVNEREVTPEETTTVLFNNSKESKLFVGLLNHLKNRLMSDNEKLHDIPEVYEPEFTGEEEQLDLAPLMAYVEGLTVAEKKLIVYGFEPINDSYGRAIGFSFYLNEAKTSGTQFRYRTPTFTYTIPKEVTETGVEQETKTEHYPLLDNITTPPDEYLKFTDVKVNASGTFEMYVDFNQISKPIREVSYVDTRSDSNVVKSESIYSKYKEVAYQAVPTYTQANIEISFVDEDNNAIGDPIVFNAHGEIIDKWQKITGDFTVPNGAGKMIISLKNDDENKVAYFDDLRIYPFDSNMKSFVYHPENQRLMSELDENNYATFYEYDPEGGLIRVKKETVKGIYTIQETRSGNIKATN